MIRFEHHRQPLLPWSAFWRRVLRHGGIAAIVISFSLAGGAAGYHFTEDMRWLDAVLNAAMILTGMGPVTELHTTAGKLFAAGFALYSGIVFLVIAGLLMAPFAHRVLHRFHVAEDGER